MEVKDAFREVLDPDLDEVLDVNEEHFHYGAGSELTAAEIRALLDAAGLEHMWDQVNEILKLKDDAPPPRHHGWDRV